MAHKDWCGKACSECSTSCGLDESIPCSPDCENLLSDGTPDRVKCLECECDVVCGDTYQFVKKCGEVLKLAKPHLIGCEYRLGKDMPESKMQSYLPEDEYVLITCENGHRYSILVSGNSLIAMASAIFVAMKNK